jgi:hypothetical protein
LSEHNRNARAFQKALNDRKIYKWGVHMISTFWIVHCFPTWNQAKWDLP